MSEDKVEIVCCPICQDELTEYVYTLRCGHEIHDGCILASLSQDKKNIKNNQVTFLRHNKDKLFSETVGHFKCPICRFKQIVSVKVKLDKDNHVEIEKKILAKVIIARDLIERKFDEIWIQKLSEILHLGRRNDSQFLARTFDIVDKMFESKEVVTLHLTYVGFILADNYVFSKYKHMTLDDFYHLILESKRLNSGECNCSGSDED